MYLMNKRHNLISIHTKSCVLVRNYFTYGPLAQKKMSSGGQYIEAKC